MHALVTDLLVYSKIASGERNFYKQVELSDIINVVTENLEFQIRDVGAKITLENSFLIIVNTIHLQQLFQNLIGNSIKFTGAGKHP